MATLEQLIATVASCASQFRSLGGPCLKSVFAFFSATTERSSMTIISAKHISQINMLVWLQEIFTVCVSFISRGEHKREVHSQIYC